MLQGILNILTLFNTLAIVGFLIVALEDTKPGDSLSGAKLFWEEEPDAKKKATRRKNIIKSEVVAKGKATVRKVTTKAKEAAKARRKNRPATHKGR
jgi:hypothetical protein